MHVNRQEWCTHCLGAVVLTCGTSLKSVFMRAMEGIYSWSSHLEDHGVLVVVLQA